MSIWNRIFAGLGGVGATLAQVSNNPTIQLISGLFAVFVGLVTNPTAPTAAAHADTAKQALVSLKK